ncbi:hypothetical protein CKM354_001082400 [Cercospora kikuchii]|uniref:F-box domain-containing protein n=1 Tax=Cercospora kikuchii TaxID=84275 RepID=A0A9P3CNE0_9PEZI|nr:uncharacterized protein CKM354_001082400 [Cercospora kikuchii]GIZ47739.1 hypothetical protein CKM354_001082400 [Cercospora kikuchii]
MASYLDDRLRCLKGTPAMRPEEANVNSEDANPQLSALFFRLPLAIRIKIYGYVFGSGNIHIVSRECTSADSWMPCYSGLTDRHAGVDDRGRTIIKKAREYRKSSYSICINNDWERVYGLSKRYGLSPQEIDDDSMHYSWLGGYWEDHEERHVRCLRPLHDFQPGEFVLLCEYGEYLRTRPLNEHIREECDKCQEVLARHQEHAGPTKPDGAAKLHHETSLHLQLFQVCRKIYVEAFKIPYEQYIFDFTSCYAAKQFAGRVLTQRQVESVHSIHLHHLDGFDDLLMLQNSFPLLKRLRVSSHRSLFFADAKTPDVVPFFDNNALEEAEVLRNDIYHSAPQHGSQEQSDFVEQLLICKSISAARALVKNRRNTSKEFGSRIRWLTGTPVIEQNRGPRPSESVVTSKVPVLRHARNIVNGFRSEHEIEIERLKAELADARHEISELKGANERRTLEVMVDAGTPGPSPVSALPAELLTRIFSFLSTRADIASYRLVCRGFREHSSPFLITEVVYAARVETIARLFDIMEHPYFSKHVTSLLYDASFYDEEKVQNPAVYAELVRNSEETFSDDDISSMEDAYIDLWCRMKENMPARIRHMMPTPDIEVILGDAFMGDRDPQAFYYQGLYQYSLAWEAQCYIHESNLAKFLFELIFCKLPKLRHVRMGDWRNLARADETVDSLRFRLFGNMLAPTVRGIETEWETPWSDFVFILEMCCCRSRGELQSISIGGHPYCSYSEMHSNFDGIFGYRPAVAFDTNFELLLSDDDPFEKLASLKSLQLPLHIMQGRIAGESPTEFTKYCRHDTFVGPLLRACSNRLTCLELTCEDGGLLASALNSEIMDLDPIAIQRGAAFLANVLFPVRFTALKHLELRGWSFTQHGIKTFLITMRGTLRKLLLLDNLFLGNSQRLAEWAGENLLLDGVQIVNYEHHRDGRPYARDLEDTWLAGRPNLLTPRQLGEDRRNFMVESAVFGKASRDDWEADIFGSNHPATFDSIEPV